MKCTARHIQEMRQQIVSHMAVQENDVHVRAILTFTYQRHIYLKTEENKTVEMLSITMRKAYNNTAKKLDILH